MFASQEHHKIITIYSNSSCLFNNLIRLIFLYLLNMSIQAQQLVYSNFFGNFNYQNDWIVQNGNGVSTICGSSNIFGGRPNFGGNTQITKNLFLLPHNSLSLNFKFWHIDNWGGERMEVYVDNLLVFTGNYNSECTQSSICGTSGSCWGDGVNSVNININHVNEYVQIKIIGYDYYWGISEFQVWMTLYIQGCNSCNIQDRFNKTYLFQQFNEKLFNQRDRVFQQLVILTFTSCFEQQKIMLSGDYIMKEIYFYNHDTICISLKQTSTQANPYIIQFYLNDEIVSSSKSSNSVFSEAICNIQNLREINIFQYQDLLPIKLTINAYLVEGYFHQIFNLNDFSLVIIIQDYEDCLDKNKDPFDGCFSGRYDCVQGCSNCIRGICIECQKGWEFNMLLQICEPICGDYIIINIEQCDDGNYLEYDGCFNCKFSCPLFCKYCEFGKCLECQSNYNFIDNKCEKINGNQEQKSQENFFNQISNFLDYGNYYHKLLHDQFANPLPIHNQDCNFQTHDIFGYQCQIKFIENCLQSLNDRCLECENFYKLSWNKKQCIPQCNDGIVILYEFCDDQNNIQFDGCYRCQSSCQLECKQCIQQQCHICIDGWKMIDNRCYQICGDGQLAISSQEQCDDGNYNPYDGCYNCKFECDPNCFSCSNSNLCLFCEINFEMDDNNKCKPICGDGIIEQGLEECEDFNDIQYDGCYQCMFQCEINCSKCLKGICQECVDGYELLVEGCSKIFIKQIDDLEDQDIKLYCGDGNQSKKEQCDDGNKEDFDGCSSKCEIEENWHCNLEQPNICYLITKFSLIYLNQTYDHQYVQLQFTNQVKQIQKFNFTQSILTEIYNLSQDQYQVIINPVVNVYETKFTMAIFEFDILHLEQISFLPNLSVSFNSSLIDNNNMSVDLSKQTIQLQQPKVMSKDLINVANKFQDLGSALMIGLGAISVLMLFFGDPQQSLEIFDTLQFQSYLKFVNVVYPQNLQIYFHSSDIVTVNPILITFKIKDFFHTIIQDNFIESIGKLQEYQINADLLINIQSQLSQISLIVFLYIICLLYPRFFNNYCFTPKFFYFISSSKSKFLEKLGIKFYKFNKKIINLRKLYTIKGFRQLFYANSWDLLFKVLLFLTSNNQQGYRSIISQCICFLVLIVFISLLCQHFKGLNKNLDFSILRIEQHEGICQLKKLLFILILIDIQESDIFQCTMITLLIFVYIGFLFMIQQNIPKIELIGLIWMEAPVMLFTLTSLVYCSDFQNYLTNDLQILIGFGQIGLLILGLLGPLIKLGIKLYRDFQQFYQKKQQNVKQFEVFNILNFDKMK